MSQPEEQSSWSRYYQAMTGRAPRPLLIESGACELAPVVAAARWAADLGCGDGTETLALLQAGWHVLAIDQQPEAIALVQSKVPAELQPRLRTQAAGFEALQLPPLDFVYAGQLFGKRDSWAERPTMTFHTLADVQALLEPFAINVLREVEEDGQAVSGPKHWHVFHIIARKR